MNKSKGRTESFAERLQKAINIRGIKKAELSRRTGINQQCLGQYVRGTYEARQSTVYVIAKALNVNPAWLAGYDVPIDPSSAKKCTPKITDNDLKLALFGTTNINDGLLEDIKNIAKIHLELSKKKNRRAIAPGVSVRKTK